MKYDTLDVTSSSRIQKTSPTWTQHCFGQIWWKEQYTGDGVINIEIDNNNYISVSVRMVHMLCHSHSGALEGLYELPDLLSWTPSMTMPWFYLGFNVRGREFYPHSLAIVLSPKHQSYSIPCTFHSLQYWTVTHSSTSLAQGVHTPGDRMISGIFNTIMRLASIEITDSSRFLLDALPCTKDTPLWAVRTALATSPPLSIFPIQFASYSSSNA